LCNERSRNAMTPGMMDELTRAVDALEKFAGVGVLIRGEGGDAFCAGGDLNSVREHLLASNHAAGMQAHMTAVLDRLSHLPMMVVAAVEGAALGGGAELLTCCDRIIAGASARVGFVHAALGVSPGWGGGMRLVDRLGAKKALDLLVSARMLDGRKAVDFGWFDEVVDDGMAVQRAAAWLDDLARRPKDAVRGAVRLIRERTVQTEREIFLGLWGSEAHRHALQRGPGKSGGGKR